MDNLKEPGKKKINEEDLGTVTGGCGYNPRKDTKFHSKMYCMNCGFKEERDGDWGPIGEHYYCPACKEKELRCDEVIRYRI